VVKARGPAHKPALMVLSFIAEAGPHLQLWLEIFDKWPRFV